MRYVAGFAFRGDAVALIRKARPTWQAGKLNAVGGKIEDGETPLDAMVREFEEEAGIRVAADDWRHVATLSGPDFTVFFFRTEIPEGSVLQSGAEEEVRWYQAPTVPESIEIVPNLRWLVPLARPMESAEWPLDIVEHAG